jgi:2-polyprenyl-3-methyl-5-hydroxy-6-metoxy-1,4-benzoquinol methylase
MGGLGRVLRKIKRWMLSRFLYYPHQVSKGEWETEYFGGQWDFLRNSNELAHNSLIAGFFHHYGNGRAVLDVGCGEGVLQEILAGMSYARYLGVDLSDEAIRRAQHKQSPTTAFVSGDATRFSPSGLFDVIVFNECLYYFDDPLSVLKRYEAFLQTGGVFVVSMFVQNESRHIWRVVDASYRVQNSVSVTNETRASWVVKVLRPKVGGGASGVMKSV